MAGGGRTDPGDKTDSHMLPDLVLGADADREDSSSPRPRTPSCKTLKHTDPRPDPSLTQHHRRGTSDRERRVRQEQEEQKATREQSRMVEADAKPHCVRPPLQVRGADSALRARA